MGEPRTVETVTIESLGHRGDGIVAGAGGPLYVPFALPGERVSIERGGDRGKIVEILDASPDRVAPICRHFGQCGGCALQMLSLDATRQLKRDFVVTALRHQGIEADIDATIGVPVASRRRAVLTAARQGKHVILGYHERLSHGLVDIEECPVLAPPLFRRLGAIRAFLAPLIPERRPVRIIAVLTATGIDLALDDAKPSSAPGLARIADAAREAGVARLSIGGEPLMTLAEPAVQISGATLRPPPGAFLQASMEAEAAIAALVTGHLQGAKRVADLFSGVGTFAFALARQAAVHAVENDGPALEAMTRAMRGATGLKPITTERRDLFIDPLSADELKCFDDVVFDPPSAGAKAQAAQLAASKVSRIAAISCNPGTFARDARILIDGGYILERVIPIDQFVYSAATEVVGLFTRR